jgi:hypothetical protein
VLVSKLNARVEHQVTFLSGEPGPLCANEALAFAEADRLARECQVDAWLTRDHTHYLRIACHRIEPRVVSPGALMSSRA